MGEDEAYLIGEALTGRMLPKPDGDCLRDEAFVIYLTAVSLVSNVHRVKKVLESGLHCVLLENDLGLYPGLLKCEENGPQRFCLCHPIKGP